LYIGSRLYEAKLIVTVDVPCPLITVPAVGAVQLKVTPLTAVTE